MVKRRSAANQKRAPRVLGVLAGAALLLFMGGELLAWAASDSGRLALWRYLHVGDRTQAVRIIGGHIQQGLSRAGVPQGAVEARVGGTGGPTLRWKVTLPRDGAPLLVNHLVTAAVEAGGAVVLSGREAAREDGALVVTLLMGVPGRATHALEIVRPGRLEKRGAHAPPRVAVLLYAAAEDESLLVAACARPETFAVGAVATGGSTAGALRAARQHRREVVLFMPMEPENYPRVNPGSATLLVNMSASRIEQALRHEIEVSRPVVAVANLMGSFATQDEPFMTAVYRELRRENLPFLHVAGVPRAVCRALASRVGAAYDEPDAMLDTEARRDDPEALDRAWTEVLERARKSDTELILLRVTRNSTRWLDRAFSSPRREGIQLVPLSTVIRRPTAGR